MVRQSSQISEAAPMILQFFTIAYWQVVRNSKGWQESSMSEKSGSNEVIHRSSLRVRDLFFKLINHI